MEKNVKISPAPESYTPREVYLFHVFCYGGIDFISRLRLRDGGPPAPGKLLDAVACLNTYFFILI